AWHHHDADGDRAAARDRRTVPAARRRRVRDHRLGEREAPPRVPARRGLPRVRDPQVAVPRPHRRHLRRGVADCDAAGAPHQPPARERGGTSAPGRRRALNLLRPKRATEWIALGLVGGLLVVGSVSVVWLWRYSVLVHRLTRGIGDTTFYAANGQP